MEEVIFFTEKNGDRYVARHFREENVAVEGADVRELKQAISQLYKSVSSAILVRLYFKKEKYDVTFYTNTSELSMSYL